MREVEAELKQLSSSAEQQLQETLAAEQTTEAQQNLKQAFRGGSESHSGSSAEVRKLEKRSGRLEKEEAMNAENEQ